MKLVAGLDAGPVALSAEVPIGADTDFEALSSTLAGIGGELLVRALNLDAEDRLEFTEQDEAAGDLRGEDRPGRAPARPRPARPPSWLRRSAP